MDKFLNVLFYVSDTFVAFLNFLLSCMMAIVALAIAVPFMIFMVLFQFMMMCVALIMMGIERLVKKI